jgi:hypothetical protein
MVNVTTDRRRGINASAAVKVACIAASTGNITLSGEQTVDGIALVDGDRVLIKDQTDGTENGIYNVSTGAWSRAPDFDGVIDVQEGTIVPVSRGTVGADTEYRISNTGTITIGTTNITFESRGSSDSSAVTYTPGGTGVTSTTVQAKLRDRISVADYNAIGDGVTDDTAAIQAAVDDAYTRGLGGVYLPSSTYVIFGTITVPAGVCLFGDTSGAEYYPGEPAAAVDGAELLKPASGSSSGAIIILDTAASLRNVYLKHLLAAGADTGILQIGAVGTTVTCYNTNTSNVHIYGVVNDDVDGTGTHYGIYFPPSDTGTAKQRYFNQFNTVFITNCDVAVRLNENSNANNFTGIITRQCIYHYEFDGGSGGVADNTLVGLGLFNIGSVSSTIQETCFVFRNNTQWNVFGGYQTEINGKAFDIDSTCFLNYFFGQENETVASFVPPGGIAGPVNGSIHARWQRPINIEQYTQMLLPTLATDGRYDTPGGCRVSMFQEVDGTANGLPQLNDAVGTLVAADADSRIIVQFNSAAMAKSVEPNFRCRLTVFVRAAGTSGQTMATVDFSYICTNTSTDAGLLSVHNVDLTPAASNYISGLWFIDGATGGTEFRIGMVGGNLSAVEAAGVKVALDIDIYKISEIAAANYTDIGFVSTAATANDVTDAIDLLTVAETVV